MPHNKGLSKQIIGGGIWIAALELSNQLLQFTKTFIAATILSPADFGIMGISFLVISALEIISTTGMKESIIQKRDHYAGNLDTAWSIELMKGLIILVLTFFLAPFITELIKPENPELTLFVVRFIGLVFFLQCATNIGVLLFEKNIQFRKFFAYQFAGTVADVITTLALVYYMKNVYALFYGVLTGFITRVVFSFVLAEYRPNFSVSFHRVKEMLSYGKWIFGSRVFNFIGLQADSILISSFFPLYSLGIYQMAFRIGNLPMSQVSNIIGRLAFPTFSKLQGDNAKLKEFFLSSVNLLAVTLLPVVILVFCLIEEFVTLFLGQKWIEIVPIVQILIMSGFIRIFLSLIDSLFCAVGLPRYSSYLQAARFFVFLIVLYPLVQHLQLVGIALSVLLSLLAVFAYFVWKTCQVFEVAFGDFNKNLFQPVIFALFIAGLLYAFKHYIENSLLTFFIAIALVITSYVGLGSLIGRFTKIKLFNKVFAILRSYKFSI